MTTRDAILICVRKQEPDIGDGALIVEGEWHYLVAGQFYVSKKEVARVLKETKP